MSKQKDNTLDLPKLSSIEEKILKDYGSGVLVSGSYITGQKETIVSISPQMDTMLGGGIKFGSFVVESGKPKTSKSITALSIGGKALQIPNTFDMPRKFYIFSIEGRLQPRDLAGIEYLRPFLEDRVVVIQSKPGQILNAEDYLSIGEQLINEMPGSIFLFDSFSQLCSKARREENIGKRFRDDVPLMLADFTKRVANIIPINQSIVLGITHVIANQGASMPGQSPWMEASGQKVQYAHDVKMRVSYTQPWKVGDKQVGIDVHWDCSATPLGPPNSKAMTKFRFNHGLDCEAELADLCSDIGIIKKGGAWYEVPGIPNKLQGAENVYLALKTNPNVYKDLYQQYRELMGLKS